MIYNLPLGNAGASLICYKLALHDAPIQYKDLVLTNLGALLYRLGHVDSALRLLQEAVAICDTEPETHFFLANLFAAKVIFLLIFLLIPRDIYVGKYDWSYRTLSCHIEA